MGISEQISRRPAVKWTVVGVLGLAVVVAAWRAIPRGGEQAEVMAPVTVTCRETGKVWTMRTAEIERQLISRKFPLNREEGLKNPDTGKLTGFPEGWEEICLKVDEMQLKAVEQANAPTKPKQE